MLTVSSYVSMRLCKTPGCIYMPYLNGKYCIKCIRQTPEFKARAAKLVLVQAQMRRDHEARLALERAGLRHLYAVGAAGAVKFGRSANLAGRLKSLQTDNPAGVTLLASLLGPASLETFVHAYLKRCGAHLRGEWFSLSHPQSQRVIGLIKAGDPDDLFESIHEEIPCQV